MRWLAHKTVGVSQKDFPFQIISKTIGSWIQYECSEDIWFQFIVEQVASWTEEDGTIHSHHNRCGLRIRLGAELDGSAVGCLDFGPTDPVPVLEERT